LAGAILTFIDPGVEVNGIYLYTLMCFCHTVDACTWAPPGFPGGVRPPGAFWGIFEVKIKHFKA